MVVVAVTARSGQAQIPHLHGEMLVHDIPGIHSLGIAWEQPFVHALWRVQEVV